ncbi:MAG: Crp/Fnr family transcriptional regulator [Sulfuricella sp.]|nr:Crp/Fnr family transcriptional regulator [Sulfuricella sp.]
MSLSADYIDEIQHIYLFEQLNQLELKRVMDHSTLLHVPSGKTLFSQGDACHHFYMVHSGMMKLFRISPDGSEKIMELVAPGYTFAEAVMFVGKYPVHAVALEDSQLVAFDCKDFRAQLHDNIEMCFRLMAGMSRRMHGLIVEIDQLTLHSGTERLARYLLDQIPADAKGAANVHLPVPKQVIASRLGFKPETFSRVLAKLRQDGLIEVHDDNILLKNATLLERFAA